MHLNWAKEVAYIQLRCGEAECRLAGEHLGHLSSPLVELLSVGLVELSDLRLHWVIQVRGSQERNDRKKH